MTAAALTVLPLASTGCGGVGGGAKTADIQPGDMPEGGDFRGVWFSPLYGNLHLVTDGDKVNGKWMRPSKDRWGELHGTLTGNVLRFAWTEHTIGAVGPNSAKEGKGYFKYVRPEGDNVDDNIVGEIGRGKDEVGEPWDAIKQRNVEPDLASIGGTGTSDIGGGDWDSENKESGTPEEPAPPP